jgi:hypothetical protein
MTEQRIVTVVPCLDEKESAQLASAVQKLVKDLGFSSEEVDRSFQESFEYFLRPM